MTVSSARTNDQLGRNLIRAGQRLRTNDNIVLEDSVISELSEAVKKVPTTPPGKKTTMASNNDLSNTDIPSQDNPDNDRFIRRAKELVVLYQLKRGVPIKPSQVYIVWFAKVLHNWKALVSTDLMDGKYYEITYNGLMSEAYLDVYIKSDNLVITDSGDKNPDPFK